MLKRTLAIILTITALLSLSSCSLLDDDYITESETESITETEVITTVDTTVNTTELLATEVGSSKEATIEDNFIMTDNSPNTEASDVSGEYVGTDEYTESSHTVSELDTTVTTEEQAPEFDIWDGTVADGFAGGDGTENSPYQIAKASQLAFLAKSVNEGNLYADNYISLACDIDLNNIDWTPIGNGIQAFMGNFDGKDHTIKNLNISQSIHYTYEYPTGRKVPYCDSGLFATVQDASINNVIIDGATIKIADAKSFNAHGGVLCGTVRTYQSTSVISNINIKNATITTEFSTKQCLERLSIGGAIGHIYAYNDTTTTISLIETDCMVSCINGYGYSNYIGTIIGSSNILDSTFVLENCAAYQTLSINPEQYYYTFTKDFCGAIGNAQASVKPFNVKNVFSKLTINKPDLDSAVIPPPAIVSHAIIGEAYYYALKDDPTAIGYEFENVFGCVEHVDTTGEKQIFTKLYELPLGHKFAQVNCQGCDVLPENHGFDTTVWDVSNLVKPTLIESTEETIGTTKEEDSFSNYIDIAVETPVTDFQYETSSEGDCIYLTKYIGTDETVIIPSQIDGLPVVSLKGISGNGYISEGVFEGTSVKKVVIPEGVTSIGLRAFKGCTELSEISVPKTLNILVNNAFENCVKLESIDLSDTIVTSLGMSAFSGCTNLKEIKFPDSLVKIEKMVFLNCSSLIELRLPPNLTDVEEGAINNCTALTTITVPPSLNMMSFDIPLPVYNAPSLEEIIFDEGREEINGYYFFAITSNAEIIIPKSVKRFSSYPFFIDADAKIVFLGNCPEIIETEEFIGNPTIYYDPSTEGWNECKWKDKYVLTPIE